MRDSKFFKFMAVALALCMSISWGYEFADKVVDTVSSIISVEETSTDDAGKEKCIDIPEEVPDTGKNEPVPEEPIEKGWDEELDLTCVEPMSGSLYYNYDSTESTTGETYWNSIFACNEIGDDYREAIWFLGEESHFTRFESDLAVGHGSRDDTSHKAALVVEVSRDNENWKKIYMTEPIRNTTMPMVISGEIPEGTRFIKVTATSDATGLKCFYMCSNYFILS